jgi:hypothetical protein
MVFFFFWKLYCIQIGDHSFKYLPNFGYTPYMKIQKFKNHFFYSTYECKTNINYTPTYSHNLFSYQMYYIWS